MIKGQSVNIRNLKTTIQRIIIPKIEGPPSKKNKMKHFSPDLIEKQVIKILKVMKAKDPIKGAAAILKLAHGNVKPSLHDVKQVCFLLAAILPKEQYENRAQAYTSSLHSTEAMNLGGLFRSPRFKPGYSEISNDTYLKKQVWIPNPCPMPSCAKNEELQALGPDSLAMHLFDQHYDEDDKHCPVCRFKPLYRNQAQGHLYQYHTAHAAICRTCGDMIQDYQQQTEHICEGWRYNYTTSIKVWDKYHHFTIIAQETKSEMIHEEIVNTKKRTEDRSPFLTLHIRDVKRILWHIEEVMMMPLQNLQYDQFIAIFNTVALTLDTIPKPPASYMPQNVPHASEEQIANDPYHFKVPRAADREA